MGLPEWAALLMALASVVVAVAAIPKTRARRYWLSAAAVLLIAALSLAAMATTFDAKGDPAKASAGTIVPGKFTRPSSWSAKSGGTVVSSGCERNVEFAPAEFAPAGTRYALVIASTTAGGTPATWYVQRDWEDTPNSPVLTLAAVPVGDRDLAGTRFYAGVFAVPDSTTRPLDAFARPSPPPGWIPASPLIKLEVGPAAVRC